MFDNLFKAVISTTVKLPIAIVKDAVTMGGALTDEKSSIVETCENIKDNLDEATKPK